MHIFLGAVGLDGIYTDVLSNYGHSTKEDRFIRQCIKEATTNNNVIYNEETKLAIIRYMFSEHLGITIKGTFSDTGKFKMDYYEPLIIGKNSIVTNELAIERHASKDSFAVVSEDIKPGTTLIFYLSNMIDYIEYCSKNGVPDYFSQRSMRIAGLSVDGKILLPIVKNDLQVQKSKKDALVRNQLINAAKQGDEEAIENLTIEDIDTYSQVSRRIQKEDIYSIVDTTFMPYGVECDQYSVIGEIISLSEETNKLTKEEMYLMTLDCNDILIDVAINKSHLFGEPSIGRRFKGPLWMTASVTFKPEDSILGN